MGWLAPLPGDESLRARFEQDGLERDNWGVRVFCAFASALLIGSAIYSTVSGDAEMVPALRIRLVALAAEAAIFWLALRPFGQRHPRVLALTLVLVLVVNSHALARYTGGAASLQYDRLDLILLGAAILMSWDVAWQLAACGVVSGVYLLGTMSAEGLGSPYFAPTFGRLLAAAIVSIAAIGVRERIRWRQLWYVTQLDEARRRSEQQGQKLAAELERRVLERTAELRASELRFRTMFDAAPIGVVAVDREGRLLQANRAFERMLDYGDGELAGRRLTELVAADDRSRFLHVHSRLCDGGAVTLPLDGHYLRRDGSALPTHAAVTAISDASGSFAYALAMVEDDSERRRAEESARQHREQLAHVLRVSTMGEMAAQLAHELNQPLGAIVNFANAVATILRDRGIDPELADAVKRIAAEGLRAGEVIRRVREFVRRSAGPRSATEVNHLAREATLLVEGDARRHDIAVRFDLDASLPAVRLDGIQIEQVILNLLRNAIEAMAAGNERDLLVRTRVAADGSVELSVRDTGVGLDGAEAERIFEAFYTTKSGGLGMGLSISRSIVEAHGGRLWSESNEGRGSTFTLSLPASAVADAAA